MIVGYTAADEGEYIDNTALGDPALLATFPPFPDDPALQQRLEGLLSGDGGSMAGSVGIGGDRFSLRLRPVDADIIRAVAAANPRTIVAVITAGAVITEEWRQTVPAVLFSWYSGSEGGHALADVLLGRVDAAGRLPFSVPTSEAHLPFFDRDATAITYDRWFGQRLLDRDGHAAAFPSGSACPIRRSRSPTSRSTTSWATPSGPRSRPPTPGTAPGTTWCSSTAASRPTPTSPTGSCSASARSSSNRERRPRCI